MVGGAGALVAKNDSKSIRKKNAALVTEIYAGAINPSEYMRIFDAWDRYYQAVSSDDQEFDEEGFDWAQEFVLHFEQAGALLDQLPERAATDPRAIVERLNCPCIIVCSDGTIEHASRSAEPLLDGVDPTAVSSLRLDPASKKALLALLEGQDKGKNRPVQPLILRAFMDGEDEPHVLFAEKLAENAEARSRYLLRSINDLWGSDVENALRKSFELTKAEIDLVKHLYEGLSVREIAEWRERSQATLRTQLSSVLQKTGVKNQATLLRMIAGLVHLVDSKKNADGGANRLLRIAKAVDQRAQTITLSNGLDIEYVESGDLSGAPFYFIQTSTDPRLSEPLVLSLKRRGVRLISPVRPGVGQTTRTPNSFSPTDWAKIHREVLDHLQVDRFACGGQCSGGPYALELGKLVQRRCAQVLLVDVGAPLTSAAMINSMPQSPRRHFYASRYFPLATLTPMKFVAADFFSGRAGEERGVKYFYHGSPTDEKLMSDPDYWRITRDNMAYSLKNVPQLMRDMTHWSRDTTDLVLSVLEHMPVRYFHGNENRMHLPANLQAFCDEHVNASCRIVDGCAQLLIYQHPDQFAEEVHKSIQALID